MGIFRDPDSRDNDLVPWEGYDEPACRGMSDADLVKLRDEALKERIAYATRHGLCLKCGGCFGPPKPGTGHAECVCPPKTTP